ncbi:MAG TPA: hypothetical protein VFQ65_09785 [Kofleriaceae bacterium]|nr:hypothetical protein [Kofleriaceae bacterium]
MLERQDIDALLVGALYGELSSAEQAQLTAHLESHPADRTALDDLKSVRARFTTSRIFEVQLDPPQAVSALLLQEAARRAPKQVIATDKKESWFDRFVRSFIAHPAMAAAATLVLVVGVAGTIYLKGGEPAVPRVAQKLDDTSVAVTAGEGAPQAAWGSASMGVDNGNAAKGNAAVVAAAPTANARADGDFKKDSVAVGLAEDKVAKASDPQKGYAGDRAQRDALAFADDAKREVVATHSAAPPPAEKPAKNRYVEVPKPSPQPKDLDEEQDSSGKDVVANNDRKEAAHRGAAGGGAATGTTAPAGPRTTTTTGAAANAPAPVVAQQAPAAPPPPAEPAASKTVAKPDGNLAWAKDQHAKIIALVKDGKCSAAVPLAATLKTRSPDYYATNVATDRSLKSCMQYVNDTSTERAAEKKASKATDTTR